jgi:signal peptidase II
LSKEIKHRWWILIVVTAAGFIIDWWTKYLAAKYLSQSAPCRLAGSYLELVLIYNRAAIFGIDPRHYISWFPVNQFFAFFTAFASIGMVVYYRYLKKTDILMHWALAVILPGALGNLFDRILYPARGVVDFIKADIGFWPFNPWPVFNMADAWVTIGIGLMILSFILEERRRKKAGACRTC